MMDVGHSQPDHTKLDGDRQWAAWSRQLKLVVFRFGLLPIISAALVLIAAPYLLPLTMPAVSPLPRDGSVAPETSKGFGLQDVIQGVRRDLMAAQTRLIDEKEEQMFQVVTFDIELSFIVKQSTGLDTKAGVPQFVVVSGTTDLAREQVQKIRLHLRVPEPPEADIGIHQVQPQVGDTINLE